MYVAYKTLWVCCPDSPLHLLQPRTNGAACDAGMGVALAAAFGTPLPLAAVACAAAAGFLPVILLFFGGVTAELAGVALGAEPPAMVSIFSRVALASLAGVETRGSAQRVAPWASGEATAGVARNSWLERRRP